MRAELPELHRNLGTTFVYVTHDQAEALTMSDRMAAMLDVDILQLGAPDDVYRNPQDLRVAELVGSPKSMKRSRSTPSRAAKILPCASRSAVRKPSAESTSVCPKSKMTAFTTDVPNADPFFCEISLDSSRSHHRCD